MAEPTNELDPALSGLSLGPGTLHSHGFGRKSIAPGGFLTARAQVGLHHVGQENGTGETVRDGEGGSQGRCKGVRRTEPGVGQSHTPEKTGNHHLRACLRVFRFLEDGR